MLRIKIKTIIVRMTIRRIVFPKFDAKLSAMNLEDEYFET